MNQIVNVRDLRMSVDVRTYTTYVHKLFHNYWTRSYMFAIPELVHGSY